MTTRLKAAIEGKINDFIAENCAEGDWPSMYCHDALAEQMAAAAYAVFMASAQGQAYAKETT